MKFYQLLLLLIFIHCDNAKDEVVYLNGTWRVVEGYFNIENGTDVFYIDPAANPTFLSFQHDSILEMATGFYGSEGEYLGNHTNYKIEGKTFSFLNPRSGAYKKFSIRDYNNGVLRIEDEEGNSTILNKVEDDNLENSTLDRVTVEVKSYCQLQCDEYKIVLNKNGQISYHKYENLDTTFCEAALNNSEMEFLLTKFEAATRKYIPTRMMDTTVSHGVSVSFEIRTAEKMYSGKVFTGDTTVYLGHALIALIGTRHKENIRWECK